MTPSSIARPLRTAVVGLGRIGYQFHVPALRADARFQLVAVVDPAEDRRTEAQGLWRVEAFVEVQAMLERTAPELVVLASPTPFHAEQAQLALAAGAHVLAEKPLARSPAELEAMIAAARRADRRLVPYQPQRYAPEVRSLRQLLQSGVLGEVHLIRRARGSYRRRRDWQAFQAHGGGLLNNYGSHCLDELLWLLDGEAIRTVYCQLRCVASVGDAEDMVQATLTTVTGRIIDLHISQAAALSGPAWQLFGSVGAARWTEEDHRIEARYFRPDEAPAAAAESGLAAAGRSYGDEDLPWRTEVRDTRDVPPYDYYGALWQHLRCGAPPPVTMEEARQLVQLIERCRTSAATGALA